MSDKVHKNKKVSYFFLLYLGKKELDKEIKQGMLGERNKKRALTHNGFLFHQHFTTLGSSLFLLTLL